MTDAAAKSQNGTISESILLMDRRTRSTSRGLENLLERTELPQLISLSDYGAQVIYYYSATVPRPAQLIPADNTVLTDSHAR